MALTRPRAAKDLLKRWSSHDEIIDTGRSLCCEKSDNLKAGDSKAVVSLTQESGKLDIASASSLVAALTRCSRSRDLEGGKWLHSQAFGTGLLSNAYVVSSLIIMYAKCGSMADARGFFDSLLHRDIVSWNCLIKGYVENGESLKALETFRRAAAEESCVPDSRTYVSALTACVTLPATQVTGNSSGLEIGKAIHSQAVMNECCSIFVENMLINMYASYGNMAGACGVFDSMVVRNVVSWTALLQGYVENGESRRALDLFHRMDEPQGGHGCVPNARTFVIALTACASLTVKLRYGSSRNWDLMEEAKGIHSRAVMSQCCDLFVESRLIDVYSKCGNMLHARSVFNSMPQRNVVSWTALLQGYVEAEEHELVLELFEDMRAECCEPDARSYVAALRACAGLGLKEKLKNSTRRRWWLEQGKSFHSQLLRSSSCDIFVESALIDMYGSCGSMFHARALFDRMPVRDSASWTALAMGYVKNEENELALELITFMDLNGDAQKCEAIMMVAALAACGNLSALETGKRFHEEISNWGLEQDPGVSSCLVEFYGKCGCMESAKRVFYSVVHKTTGTWNALLCGYSLQNNNKNNKSDVQHFWEKILAEMKEQGSPPNADTFIFVLTACSHAGMIEQGKDLFSAMYDKYGVLPEVEHYNSLVDMLARANHVKEAMQVVKNMKVEPNAVTWRALLSGCCKWKNVEVGEVAYQSLLKLQDTDPAAYNLMANLYGAL